MQQHYRKKNETVVPVALYVTVCQDTDLSPLRHILSGVWYSREMTLRQGQQDPAAEAASAVV